MRLGQKNRDGDRELVIDLPPEVSAATTARPTAGGSKSKRRARRDRASV
jgi:hypothetical protein